MPSTGNSHAKVMRPELFAFRCSKPIGNSGTASNAKSKKGAGEIIAKRRTVVAEQVTSQQAEFADDNRGSVKKSPQGVSFLFPFFLRLNWRPEV